MESHHHIFADYAQFIIKQNIYPFINKKCTGIHVLFDNQSPAPLRLKIFERERRDAEKSVKKSTTHCKNYDVIEETDQLPKEHWNDFIANRNNKNLLVEFLST